MIKEIKSWCDQNYLKLNNNKTKFLAISTKQYKSPKIKQLEVMGQKFKVEDSVKNLGFILDKHLDMTKQINRVCSTGYGMLKNLWKISKKVNDIGLKTQLVHSSILSRINYCSSLYTFLPKKQTKKLQKLINAATRFIFNIKGKDRFNHITPWLKQLHFLPMEFRTQYKICLLVYKCLNNDKNNSAQYLTDLINIREPKIGHNLRKDNDTTLLKFGTLEKHNYKNRGFSHAAPVIWNNLPSDIREIKTMESFKSNLKTFYFNKWNNNS